MLASAAAVNRQAEGAYRQTLKQAQAKGRLNPDAEELAQVRAIAARLIAATGAFRPDAPGWRWEVNVLEGDEVNAWCMPGGKIAVYTGLLDKVQPTDDELAAVIGHEIAHALREHGREKSGQAMGVGVAAAIGGVLLGSTLGIDPGLGQSVLGKAGDLAFMRPNSREMEQEADRIGVELAARAGYDPHAAISLWEKMRRVSDGAPPQWLSTHPSHETRIADLKVHADRVDPLYRPGMPRR
ncbi:M48 family metallopeptidase [Azospira restricta]|uniref:M48 family metallopeptidase n=2 Tax=Azospira restricta TaxID=404405 RepID=A0A974SSL5_9RHOO|nr:M48 family metallopeptidase [Azospira restricta]